MCMPEQITHLEFTDSLLGDWSSIDGCLYDSLLLFVRAPEHFEFDWGMLDSSIVHWSFKWVLLIVYLHTVLGCCLAARKLVYVLTSDLVCPLELSVWVLTLRFLSYACLWLCVSIRSWEVALQPGSLEQICDSGSAS